MNPLVDKKYIFTRTLAGKPIVLNLMEIEDRLRYQATKELFFETGVFEYIDPTEHRDHHDTLITHTIHIIIPRNGMPHVMDMERGYTFARAAYGENNTQYLP
jgi:hypothetical protein